MSTWPPRWRSEPASEVSIADFSAAQGGRLLAKLDADLRADGKPPRDDVLVEVLGKVTELADLCPHIVSKDLQIASAGDGPVGLVEVHAAKALEVGDRAMHSVQTGLEVVLGTKAIVGMAVRQERKKALARRSVLNDRLLNQAYEAIGDLGPQRRRRPVYSE